MQVSLTGTYPVNKLNDAAQSAQTSKTTTTNDSEQPHTDSVNISNQAQRYDAINKAYSGTYDARAMSPNQMVAFAKSLYENGYISDEESSRMQFVLDPAQMTPDGIPLDHDKPIDQLAIWTTQVDLQKKFGQPAENIAFTQGIVDILKSVS